jgi:phage portal protein BeeE
MLNVVSIVPMIMGAGGWRAARAARLLELGEQQLATRAAAGSPLPVPTQPYDGAVSAYAPEGALEHLTLEEMFGSADADFMTVDRDRAMSLGAVAKGRHLIAGQIATFPLVHMVGNKRAAEQSLLCRQPEAGRPLHTSLTWWVDSLIFYGRAWLVVTERYADTTNGNRPRRLRWVPEWDATVDARGRLVAARGYGEVAQRDVVRIDGPHEGLLNYGAGLIREAVSFDIAAANAAENPVPSINLHQVAGEPLNREQIKELLATWRAARRKRGGGVGFTNASIEAEAMGQPVEQLLIEGRNIAALNLARAMGLPAWAVDASVQGTSLNYSNAPSRSRELIDYALKPYMAAIEGRLSLDDVLPSGHWCRFDTSALLQGNFGERMTAYKAAIDAGIYTAEECRALEAGYVLEGANA